MKNELKFDSEMCKKMDKVEKMLWVIMDSNETVKCHGVNKRRLSNGL